MSVLTAASAFTHRAARRGARLQLLAYSGTLAGLLVVVAGWIVARAERGPGGNCYDYCRAPPMSWSVLALADVFAVGLLGLGLLVIAPAAVAAAVAAERRAGTLDQLRTTPLSPLALACGIVVGAPARIYLLLLGPLALHVACGLGGVIPLDGLVGSVAVLATGGIASVLFGLAVALAPRQETGGAFVALGVAAVLGLGAVLGCTFATDNHLVGWAFLHPGGGLDAAMLQHDGLWRRLAVSSWRLDRFDDGSYGSSLALLPLLSCASSLALAVVLAAACCRKLAAPHLALFSKPQALLLFTGVAAGALLPLRYEPGYFGNHATEIGLAFAAVVMPIAALLALFATPGFESWALALRGGKRIGSFHDDAPPHLLLWATGLIFAGLLAVVYHGRGVSLPSEHHLVAIGWTALVVASAPVFILFLATRYTTPAARWAFGAAAVTHLIGQVIAVAIVADSSSGYENLFVQAAAVLGVAVPVWVAIRQSVLRRRTLAATAT